MPEPAAIASRSFVTSACRNARASFPANLRRPRADRSIHPAPAAMMRYWLAMRSIRRYSGHLIVAILGLTMAPGGQVAAQSGQTSQTATFNIVVRGARVGFETVAVTSSAGGYDISSAGRQIAPVDLVVTRFNVVYTPDWQPQRLTIEGVLKGQLITLGASFGLTTVNVDVMQAGQKGSALQQVTPRTIVIPNNFYGSYEALAMRLGKCVGRHALSDLHRAGRRGVRHGRSDHRSALFDADRTDRSQAGRHDLLDAAGLDGRRAVDRRAQSPRANRDSGAVARRIARRSLVGDDARGVHEERRRLDALHSEQRFQPRRHGDDADRRRGEERRPSSSSAPPVLRTARKRSPACRSSDRSPARSRTPASSSSATTSAAPARAAAAPSG